jgi:hypothetical protein
MENNRICLYDQKKENFMKRKYIFVLLALLLTLVACVPSQQQVVEILSAVEQTAAAQVTFVAPPTSSVDEIVQATFQGLTAQAELVAAASGPTSTPLPVAAAPTQGGTDNIPTSTPEGGLSGSFAGQLSYPSEFIPAQAIVAYAAGGNSQDYYYIITNEGTSSYQFDNLPPGNYYVVAYVLGGGLSAGYSQAVPCGLSADCTDHSLISVTVTAGQVTQGVNPQDWYAPEGSFPAYPIP